MATASAPLTPTAPLPSAAAEALRSLELRVTALRYRDAAEHCRAASAAGNIDGCLAAQDEMRMCRCQLEKAGRLDLIDGVYAKAARYRALSALIDRLSMRESHYMTPADWRDLSAAQDERAAIHFELKRTGRLDLIEVAS